MKRWIRRIALYLFVGAIINVAVAWACAIWGYSVPGVELSPLLFRDVGWPRAVPPNWPPPTAAGVNQSFSMTVVMTEAEFSKDTSPRRSSSDDLFQSIIQYGLPFRSLECEIQGISTNSGPFTLRSIARVGPVRDYFTGNDYPFIPLRPIWPAFLANSVIYAVVTWSLFFFAPSQIRRRVRRNRGRCAQCGYDLQGELDAGCPECGWNRHPLPGAVVTEAAS